MWIPLRGLGVPRRGDVCFTDRFVAERNNRLFAGASLQAERAQADENARDFFRAIRDDTLNGYEVSFVAEPEFPKWATALGLQPVQVHQSAGNRQWVLVRTER